MTAPRAPTPRRLVGLGLALALTATLGSCGRASTPSPDQGAAKRSRADDVARPRRPQGRALAVHSEGHDRHGLALVDLGEGTSEPLSIAAEPEGAATFSVYPVGVLPDRRGVVVLASLPGAGDPSRTLDRLGVIAGKALREHEEGAALPVRWIGDAPHTIRNPALSADGTFVVYESNRESFRDLYRVALAGGAPRRLTDHEAGDYDPTLSPDGMQVAFVSSRDRNPELYRASLFGEGEPTRLTQDPAADGAPVWSPSADLLVFASRRDPARGRDLFRMRPDGAQVRPLMPEARGKVSVQHPAFSPDGRAVAFSELRPGEGAQVVVVAVADGRELYRSASDGAVDDWPAWSPDGAWLLFSRGAGAEASRLAAVELATGATTLLTAESEVLWMPHWLEP